MCIIIWRTACWLRHTFSPVLNKNSLHQTLRPIFVSTSDLYHMFEFHRVYQNAGWFDLTWWLSWFCLPTVRFTLLNKRTARAHTVRVQYGVHVCAICFLSGAVRGSMVRVKMTTNHSLKNIIKSFLTTDPPATKAFNFLISYTFSNWFSAMMLNRTEDHIEHCGIGGNYDIRITQPQYDQFW